MACSKTFIVFPMTLAYLIYLSDAADLVAPNSLADGQSLQEGDYRFENQGCILKLTFQENVILENHSDVEGSCTLTMREDGELAQTRDSDGAVSYTSETASVLNGVIDSYVLHLDGNGQLAIERSDGSVILELNPAS